MTRPRWLTPDAAVGSRYVYRRVRIPQEFITHVNGALDELTQPENWEAFGDITPEDAAALMLVLWEDYTGSTYPMIGMIAWWAGTLPANVLPCDGTVYNRVDYPDLYDALDAAYIIDVDTFKVPDMRDMFPLGEGTRAIGDTGGEETHTLITTEMPAHAHSYLVEGVEMGYLGAEPALVPFENVYADTGSAGGDQAHNNMPPFLVNRWGIIAS